ncbi:hypothetical protein C8R43DRAFT_1033422 [Mycena crocata]|nr:hypothetical protein C8R43DRAFT_1033422 [Mycena crocata]
MRRRPLSQPWVVVGILKYIVGPSFGGPAGIAKAQLLRMRRFMILGQNKTKIPALIPQPEIAVGGFHQGSCGAVLDQQLGNGFAYIASLFLP